MKELFGQQAVKVNSKPGDGHKNGTPCIVVAESHESPMGIIYLALFKDFPVPVAIADIRVRVLHNKKKVKVELNNSQQLYLKRFPKELFKFYEKDQAEDQD